MDSLPGKLTVIILVKAAISGLLVGITVRALPAGLPWLALAVVASIAVEAVVITLAWGAIMEAIDEHILQLRLKGIAK